MDGFCYNLGVDNKGSKSEVSMGQRIRVFVTSSGYYKLPEKGSIHEIVFGFPLMGHEAPQPFTVHNPESKKWIDQGINVFAGGQGWTCDPVTAWEFAKRAIEVMNPAWAEFIDDLSHPVVVEMLIATVLLFTEGQKYFDRLRMTDDEIARIDWSTSHEGTVELR
jgi:hypothetical protein